MPDIEPADALEQLHAIGSPLCRLTLGLSALQARLPLWEPEQQELAAAVADLQRLNGRLAELLRSLQERGAT